MEALPWVFSSGWASGINSYAVVLLLGLAGRFLGVEDVPAALTGLDERRAIGKHVVRVSR